MKHIPNIISVCRIILSISLLFFFWQPVIFFSIYFICGLSDIVDGLLARGLKVAGILGASLDSIGDFFLLIIMLIYCFVFFGKDLYPYYPFLAAIFCVRIIALLFAAIKFHTLVMLHTRSNKIMGFLTFFTPVFLMLANPAVIYSVLGIGLFSALEELILHIISKNPDPDKRGIL
jgi:CDP-diacylglycerol--glycerol-3-phosphate 3-phosphatidyltransferase